MAVINLFSLSVFILQISHLHPSHLRQCSSRPHTPPRHRWRAGEWCPLKRARVETKEEEQGATGPERVRTPEPARPNARRRRSDKRLLMEGKGIKVRVAARHGNKQVGRQHREGIFHCCVLCVNLKSQFPKLLLFAPRLRGHSALQPTTVPHSQQPPGPELLQLHVLQGLRRAAERGGRPQEPCRHGPQHHGGLSTRRWRARGTKL